MRRRRCGARELCAPTCGAPRLRPPTSRGKSSAARHQRPLAGRSTRDDGVPRVEGAHGAPRAHVPNVGGLGGRAVRRRSPHTRCCARAAAAAAAHAPPLRTHRRARAAARRHRRLIHLTRHPQGILEEELRDDQEGQPEAADPAARVLRRAGAARRRLRCARARKIRARPPASPRPVPCRAPAAPYKEKSIAIDGMNDAEFGKVLAETMGGA